MDHSDNMYLYKLLCILRILLAIVPQSGYVHPDEHFQGPEVAYGDIAGYKVYRAWEFTSSKPIRSIIFPYIISGIPSTIMKILESLHYKTDTYWIIILPRLVMCLLSFLQDFCIYKISIRMKRNHEPSLILFASSYVTLVYLTRTLSNSLESLLFAFLIFLFINFFIFHRRLVNGDMSILRKFMLYSFMFSITLAIGYFNRPTFFCFSIFPTIVWCLMLYKLNINQKINVVVSFFLGIFSIIICYIAIDSFYYNKTHYSSINLFSNVIITPVNFILYNLNTTNLNNHGLHSRWLHTFINIPLVFSIYGILILLSFVKNLYLVLARKKLPSSEILLYLLFIIPLFLLSLIPHQEPRFIIPLIIPLCLLYGNQQVGIESFVSKKFCIWIWIISNILCLIFYGFIHQAGVYLSASYLNSRANNNSAIIYYKTYMPPQYLFSIQEHKDNINVHDLAGRDFETFQSYIHNIASTQAPSTIFIVLPSKILTSNTAFEILFKENYKIVGRIQLFPHLSTENPPKLTNLWHLLTMQSSFMSTMHKVKELFCIQIITFEKL